MIQNWSTAYVQYHYPKLIITAKPEIEKEKFTTVRVQRYYDTACC
jgi:hypothetical protein